MHIWRRVRKRVCVLAESALRPQSITTTVLPHLARAVSIHSNKLNDMANFYFIYYKYYKVISPLFLAARLFLSFCLSLSSFLSPFPLSPVHLTTATAFQNVIYISILHIHSFWLFKLYSMLMNYHLYAVLLFLLMTNLPLSFSFSCLFVCTILISRLHHMDSTEWMCTETWQSLLNGFNFINIL